MVYELISDYIASKGISRAELGRVIGLSRQSASQLFNGERALKADEYIEICKYLGVPPETFLEE